MGARISQVVQPPRRVVEVVVRRHRAHQRHLVRRHDGRDVKRRELRLCEKQRLETGVSLDMLKVRSSLLTLS